MMSYDECNWLKSSMDTYLSDCCSAFPIGEVMVLDLATYAIGICSRCYTHTGFTQENKDEDED